MLKKALITLVVAGGLVGAVGAAPAMALNPAVCNQGVATAGHTTPAGPHLAKFAEYCHP
ncbi:hypothetical protein GCM10009819_08870 [Agromyces tropicus]|uniref:Uncharacterized protein n=1 Tax=Agromyces tropicus TaxID=555371 RepID=A0ABP5FIX7_9MICO